MPKTIKNIRRPPKTLYEVMEFSILYLCFEEIGIERGRTLGAIAEQPLTLCGSDKDGNDFSNELSRMILDIYDELDIYNPRIQIRCHKNMDNVVFRKAVSMIRGGYSSSCLVNDQAVFAGYEKLGVPKVITMLKQNICV